MLEGKQVVWDARSLSEGGQKISKTDLKVANTLSQWRILCPQQVKNQLDSVIGAMERLASHVEELLVEELQAE